MDNMRNDELNSALMETFFELSSIMRRRPDSNRGGRGRSTEDWSGRGREMSGRNSGMSGGATNRRGGMSGQKGGTFNERNGRAEKRMEEGWGKETESGPWSGRGKRGTDDMREMNGMGAMRGMGTFGVMYGEGQEQGFEENFEKNLRQSHGAGERGQEHDECGRRSGSDDGCGQKHNECGPGNRDVCGHSHEHGHRPDCERDFRGRRPPLARERVLRIIEEMEGISQKKIALLLAIRPQSLSELLVRLERDGFIERRQSEKDKRETLVYLTERGKERAKEVYSDRKKIAEHFFEPLTDGEKDLLLQLMKKLCEANREERG